MPVEVVRWGLDLDAFAPGDRAPRGRRSVSLRTGRSSRAFAGLSAVYNPELLLEAFARVQRCAPRCAAAPQAPADERHRTPSRRRSSGSASPDAVTVLGNVARAAAGRLPRSRRRHFDRLERQLAALGLGGARLRAAGGGLGPAVGARRAAGRPGFARAAGRGRGCRGDRRILDDDGFSTSAWVRPAARWPPPSSTPLRAPPGRRALPVGPGGVGMSEPRRHLGAGAALSVVAQAGPLVGGGRAQHRAGTDDRSVGKRPLRAPADLVGLTSMVVSSGFTRGSLTR